MACLIILSMVAFFLLLLGFLMWKFHLAGLVAGYEADKVKDPKGLAEWVGKCLMSNGLLAGLLGIGNYYFDTKNGELVTMMLFMVLSTLSMTVTLAGTQRYMR